MATPAPAATPSRRASAWPWLVLLLLTAAVWAGWSWWQLRQVDESAARADAEQRLDALGERVEAMRRDQRAQVQRLQQAEATNRILRDELLGIGERAALIEDSVARFADPDRHGAQALRLDEAELLLSAGAQRLQVAGDLDGMRRAYALAAGVLEGVDDPAYLSLRQTLQQERAALDAIGAEPRVLAIARLDTFVQGLAVQTGRPPPAPDARAPWWQRAFGQLVDVRRSDAAVAVQPADRLAAEAGLQLEISLARAAAERRDSAGFRSALRRADQWLTRLAPASAARDRDRATLAAIAALPLSLSLPTLGSTLRQLRQSRAAT